ncbi:CU044_2847 family protein [Streptomyces sp. HNM0663]|uniref:CU044_2847 family protein n=1 Tax=Streptomyces chengmaiensis TaxID=3040919 RepID=A0ABT6HPU8_9ACTN|nr:CU044_2847 family protein [Streptomyces chengmaiensis]MDH2390746.1 CU044_2847 family protein [Streptomyces chengmaiensis]
MPTFTELELADGTSVRFEATAVTPGTPAHPAGDTHPAGAADPADEDLPDGMGRSVPVSRGRGAAAFAVDTLRTALRPLGPLLQEVHDAVVASDAPPQEVNVTFGVQVGHDLKLGIVGGSGQAHITVSATWQPAPAPGRSAG